MIEEKEKPKSLLEAIKERIKYLEAHDPDNETLELLKHHIADQDWKILPS